MESLMYDIPVICGPTASGKTSLGIALAERAGGEIISMDSRQIYRGLDIGTAKPDAEELARVPHHLIDIVEPGERFTVADFVNRAQDAIRDIAARGKRPIIVGGTPFYLSALLGDFDFCEVDTDPEYRDALNDEAARLGTGVLFERLRDSDPASAGKIHPNDLFRIVRALEILRVTGEPPSLLRTQSVSAPARPPGSGFSFRVFCLHLPREILYYRINKRSVIMYNMGLAGEIRSVLDRNGAASEFLKKIIGYSECLSYLEGETALEQAVAETQKRTRRFAKRQLTWLRALEGVTWLNAGAGEQDAAFLFLIEKGLN
jgi:tRNA dimethylallyltransferase